MNLASILENQDFEKRIAVTPEIAKKYTSLGFNLSLPKNYGTHLGFSDKDYQDLGVNIFALCLLYRKFLQSLEAFLTVLLMKVRENEN